jgi:acetyl-CoA carboxylase biotin carboxyl carrier protein
MKIDDIKQLLELVREHDLTEFELEQDGLKLRVNKGGTTVMAAPAPVSMPMAQAHAAPMPVAAPPAAPAAAAPAPVDEGAALAVVKAPIVGTLYRSPEPGAKPFAEVGTTVRKGQVLCIIEAMKLMNEIEAEVDGEIAAVYVENGQPVQFGDRLFAIKAK